MVIWGFVCRYVSILYFSLFGAITAEESKKDREVEEGIGGSGMGLCPVMHQTMYFPMYRCYSESLEGSQSGFPVHRDGGLRCRL